MRLIALDPHTVAALQAHKEWQDQEREDFGPDYHNDNGRVFTWEDGRPVHPDVLRQRFNRLVEQLGLPRIRLHDLRHCHATAALKAGVPAKVVSARLGHASVTFTLSVYAHLVPGFDREAANTVADLLSGSPPESEDPKVDPR